MPPPEEIIQRINEELMGEFTDADRVIVETLYNKMKMEMAAYAENTEAYKQLFLDAKKYHAVQAALADKLYRELHS